MRVRASTDKVDDQKQLRENYPQCIIIYCFQLFVTPLLAETSPLSSYHLTLLVFTPIVLLIIINIMLSLRKLASAAKGLRMPIAFGYSSGPVKDNRPQESLQDWEYCRLISQQLKGRNVNAGLSLLFESYFNGKVLDIQIYNCIFHSIHQQNLPLSYSEILYQLYREHFPPHLLMLHWMNKLAATHHEPLLEQLKLDFDAINQPFPKKPSRREQKQEKQHPAIKESEETSRTRKSRSNRNSEGSQSGKASESPEVLEQYEAGLTPQELLKLKMETDFRSVIGQLNSGLGNYGKVNLYDVEIEFNDQAGQDQGDHHMYQEEGPEDNEVISDMGMMGLDISKIKIGRVEFIADPNNDKHDS